MDLILMVLAIFLVTLVLIAPYIFDSYIRRLHKPKAKSAELFLKEIR